MHACLLLQMFDPWYPPCCCFFGTYPHFHRDYGLHNRRFLHRNWWRGITSLAERSRVTTHICCVLGWPDGRRRVVATATEAFIHSKCGRSHQLQAGEIPFIESLGLTWGRLKIIFCISALTPSVKTLGLISTFAPIGMLDLSWTLALTPNLKWALCLKYIKLGPLGPIFIKIGHKMPPFMPKPGI